MAQTKCKRLNQKISKVQTSKKGLYKIGDFNYVDLRKKITSAS